jgi:galactarate dehydratase
MSNWIPGRAIPVNVPGEDLTIEDMSRVTADDWADLRSLAVGYCRAVDATRSRKRVDGSATITHNGRGTYGTDDLSDDVAQDAVLLFARRLRDVLKGCPTASAWIDSREPASWEYRRKDGSTMVITRKTLLRWAVRDAAARNGYRLDVPPDEVTEAPGAQRMRGVPHVEQVTALAAASGVSQLSEAIMRRAWGDGSDFPTLGKVLFLTSEADNLKRDGILSTVAQAEHGGAYGSRRNVRRTRDRGRREWEALSERLDQAREDMIHKGMRPSDTTGHAEPPD